MGTVGAHDPFWSSDNRSVGFFADQKLKRIDIESGLIRTLTDAQFGRGGAWSEEDVLLFAPNATGPLHQVAAGGGSSTPVTALDNRAGSHRYPQLLAGGHHFLFHAQVGGDETGIYIGSLDSPATQRLTPAASSGAYVVPGWLLFSEQGTLVARAFDLESQRLTGPPVRLSIGSPAALFRTTIVGGGSPPAGIDFEYDVAPDGRFLININSAPTASITIVQNWKAGVK